MDISHTKETVFSRSFIPTMDGKTPWVDVVGARQTPPQYQSPFTVPPEPRWGHVFSPVSSSGDLCEKQQGDLPFMTGLDWWCLVVLRNIVLIPRTDCLCLVRSRQWEEAGGQSVAGLTGGQAMLSVRQSPDWWWGVVLIINNHHTIIISDLLTSLQTLARRGPAWKGVRVGGGWADPQYWVSWLSAGGTTPQLYTPGQNQIQTLSNLVNLCLETSVRSLLQDLMRSFPGQIIHYKYFEPIILVYCYTVYNGV